MVSQTQTHVESIINQNTELNLMIENERNLRAVEKCDIKRQIGSLIEQVYKACITTGCLTKKETKKTPKNVFFGATLRLILTTTKGHLIICIKVHTYKVICYFKLKWEGLKNMDLSIFGWVGGSGNGKGQKPYLKKTFKIHFRPI